LNRELIKTELVAYGFDVAIVDFLANKSRANESAFVKTNTRTSFLNQGVPHLIVERLSREQVLKLKVEIDRDPPGGFQTEAKYM
jgi:hypothetical protein